MSSGAQRAMDEQRMQAYVGLIEQLLGCAQGEEGALLQANAGLVDAGLVAEMGQYADWLVAEEKPNASWLRQVAAQLALGLVAGIPSSSTSEDAVRFGAETIQLFLPIQGDQAQVYEFFRANVERLNEALLRALPDLFSILIQSIDPSMIATVFVKFSNWINQFPLGNRMLNLELGIAAYEQALQVYTRDAFPQDWAMTQNNLAMAYKNRIRGERADNLEQAITAYEQALQVYTRDAFPQDWAMTQNNLATAYKNRIRGERADNLEQAIAAYQLALQVYTRDAFPQDWAGMQNNLANAYSNRICGERADNLERAIAAYEQALQVRTRTAFPQDWAMTQNNLANAYSNRIRGERADNLEQAIAAYEQALQVRTRTAFPQDWAMTQNNLALAYAARIRGERADNLERAIAAYEQALQVRTRTAFPQDWAMTQNNLAMAYKNRIRGERADNLEQAIAAYQLALQVYTRDAFPEQWAGMQNNLANAYSNRIRGERADNLEQAIAAYEQALQVYTRDAFPQDWAMTQNNLANVYSNRICGERADNLEQAISAYEQALQVRTRTAFPEQWAMTQNNLAVAYKNRIRGERADNLEQAITAYQQALQVYTCTAFPEQWAMTQNNLASAYQNRIRRERADNLEQAISAYEQALQVHTRDAFPEQWAMTQNNLASAYSNRIRGERADNLEQAISAYEQALQVYTRDAFPEQWAMTQNNLASAYSNRIRGERADNLEQAISAYEQALQVYTRTAFPEQWAMTQNNLASAYQNRIRGERADNLEQAILAYEQALQVRTRTAFPEQWAMTQNNLASAYRNCIRGERADNLEQAFVQTSLEKAIAAYEQALQVYTRDAFPKECRGTAQNLGNLHWQEKSWAAARDAYQIAIAAAETLYQSSISYAGKGDELKATADLPRRLAYAHTQLGNLQAAVLTLEQGRARGLSESLDRDRANLTQLQTLAPTLYTEYQDITQQLRNLESRDRDRMVSDNRDRVPEDLINTTTKLRQALDQTIAQIHQVSGYENFLTPTQWKDIAIALRQDNPLVYLVTTPNGGMVLIVTVDAIEVLWLDDLTETQLIDLLKAWFAAYDNSQTDRQAWYDAIDTTTRQLWNALMGLLVQKLQDLGFECITLIPTGDLSFLPLHAAWIEDHSKPTGRRYVLDDIHITYAPNAKSLTAAQAIVDRVQANSILAIDNPRQDLPNSEREITTAISTFSQPSVLRHERATIAAAKEGLVGAAIAHFSCHGTANLNEPLNSGLLMSDGLLTLKDIFALNLAESGGLRLAILSACETSMIGLENADEAISLPTGLLQAGVAAVIASLWSVSDLSTMMMLTRFYDCWRTEGIEMDQALRHAQQWVRDTTNAQKYDYLKERFQKLADAQQITTHEVNDLLREFMSRYTIPYGPHERSFAHPFHWAAFSYTGV